ncbi:MAG TPA: hypothetical protein VLG27_04390 [Candidatus Saccharimonadia bacterium]|nr:hypothetical protein [Candidatus Saccharimonadia bacterium]
MATATFNGQDIEITSVYLRKDGDQIRFESFPRRLVYKGREYILAD